MKIGSNNMTSEVPNEKLKTEFQNKIEKKALSKIKAIYLNIIFDSNWYYIFHRI